MIKLPSGRTAEDLQDGILVHYLEQANASDANVEKRLEQEAFDYRDRARLKNLSNLVWCSEEVRK